MSRKHLLKKIDINIKNILCMLISFRFNYISYQIFLKKIVWINKIDLYVRTNLIIYVIVTDF